MKTRLISVIVAFAMAMVAVPAFGATHTHDGVTFEIELTNGNLSTYVLEDAEGNGWYLTEGNYYLGEDLNLDKTIRIYGTNGNPVNLCLNGHTINGTNVPASGADAGSAIRITCKGSDEGTLNLHDCGNTGSIKNAPGCGIRVESGTLNAYGGTITGNNIGVAVQGGCNVSVAGDTTITGNVTENLSLSLKIGTSFLFETINVDDGFTGNIGVTLRDTSGTLPDVHYGVFTTANNVNLKGHFSSDLENYSITYNSDKCLEVLEPAEVVIRNQKGTLLKKITGRYTGHKVTLPTKLKTGYDFKEYTYTESYSTKTAAKGEEFVIPKKDTELTASMYIVLTQQPTAEKPGVATDAKNVNYQWYKREVKTSPVNFISDGEGGSYWANNNSPLEENKVYHLTFHDGVPAGLTFNLGTATKTGENTYDVTAEPFLKFGPSINISATSPINVTVTTEKECDSTISGETGATLSEPVPGEKYFCRVTDSEDIYTDSNVFVATKQQDGKDSGTIQKKSKGNDLSDKGTLTGDNADVAMVLLIMLVAISGAAIALVMRRVKS